MKHTLAFWGLLSHGGRIAQNSMKNELTLCQVKVEQGVCWAIYVCVCVLDV